MKVIVEGLAFACRWTLVVVVIFWIVASLANGFSWTNQLSTGYGLLIIRLAVSIVLSIVSLITLVFQQTGLVLFYLANLVGFIFPLTFAVGLARSVYASIKWNDRFEDEVIVSGGFALIASLVYLPVLFYFGWCLKYWGVFYWGVLEFLSQNIWFCVITGIWAAIAIFSVEKVKADSK